MAGRTFSFGVRITGDARDGVQAMQMTEREMKGLRRELQRTDQGFSRSRQSFDKWSRGMLNARNVIGGLATGLAGAAFTRRATEALRLAEEVERMSLSLGASAETVQELGFAFGQFGLQSDDVSDALNTLADRAEDAQEGTQSFIDDFRLLGVEVDDLRGREPAELFELIARRVAQIEDPTQRAAGVVRIFGDDLGRRLLPLLLEGAEGLNRYALEAERLGVVLDEQTLEAMSSANREFRTLRFLLDAQFAQAVGENAEELENIAETFTSEEFQRGLGVVVGFFTDLSNVVSASVEQLGNLSDLLSGNGDLRALLYGSTFGLATGSAARVFGENDPATALGNRLDRLAEARRGRAAMPRGELQQLERDIVWRAAFLDFANSEGAAGGGGSGSGGSSPTRTPWGTTVWGESAAFQNTLDWMNAQKMIDAQRVIRPGESYLGTGEMLPAELPEVTRSFRELEEAEREALETGRELDQMSQDLGFTMSSAFEDAVLAGEDLRGVVQGLLQDIARLTLRHTVTKRVADAISSGVSGLFSDGSSSTPISGKLADGGPVAAGSTYLVGERGPELFSPSRSGQIIPNHAMGMPNISINVINQDGGRLEPQGQRSRRGPNGDVVVDVVVKNSMQRLDSRGELDGIFRRHGASRQGQF